MTIRPWSIENTSIPSQDLVELEGEHSPLRASAASSANYACRPVHVSLVPTWAPGLEIVLRAAKEYGVRTC